MIYTQCDTGPAKKRITSTYYNKFYLENIAFGEACNFLSLAAREDKGDREGISHTHPIP